MSWGELLSAMLLPQNPDFSFGSRFELFQEYFFSLGSAPLSAAFWVVVGELSEKGINVLAVFGLGIVDVFAAGSDTGTNVVNCLHGSAGSN